MTMGDYPHDRTEYTNPEEDYRMDNGRLQEIKDSVDKAKLEVGSREYPSLSWLGWVVENVPLLIAAVEASQQELAEAREWKDTWKDRCRFGIAKLRERKKELAWAEASIANWVDYVEYMTNDRNNYRKRWREAEAGADTLQERCTELVEEKVQRIYHRETVQVTDLRAQLATSTIAVDAAKKFMEKAEMERDEAQAEVERLQRNNNANEEHIAEHGI